MCILELYIFIVKLCYQWDASTCLFVLIIKSNLCIYALELEFTLLRWDRRRFWVGNKGLLRCESHLCVRLSATHCCELWLTIRHLGLISILCMTSSSSNFESQCVRLGATHCSESQQHVRPQVHSSVGSRLHVRLGATCCSKSRLTVQSLGHRIESWCVRLSATHCSGSRLTLAH